MRRLRGISAVVVGGWLSSRLFLDPVSGVALGIGVHRCVGAPPARVEALSALPAPSA
ncbi:hypothetical protein ACGFY9_43000 [Streptomyces sp. NPDC048504]|uniref:hypothetical protein n=1 Tax=Streptomyces sp. NPDC048504 TaxID=3365559 RepID=UPI0037197D39